ncbi:Calcineurin-like phosphoesterase [Candidatus Kryptobacter tengchongensis]|nr:Calcineurin-like phosphoesterase [Candidatus Kryptobacter tengchongensis]
MIKQPEKVKEQKTKEQPRQYKEDAEVDIESMNLEDFIKELYLPEIQRILSEETTGWVDEYLKTQNSQFESLTEADKQKEREKLLEKFKDLKTREDLLRRLKEIGRIDKITNIFGMIYIPEDYEIIAVTDVHGDIEALDRAIEEFEVRKRNNKKVAFVCLGDFVDRGEYSFEVVKRLFELKRKYSDEVVILKADHEAEIGRIMPADFYDKVEKGGKEKVKALYDETFLKLPYGIIWSDFLFFHGGLPLFSKFEFKQKDPNQSDADFIKEKAKLGALIGLIDQAPEGIQ